MSPETEFPQYRKYRNNRSYFRILSPAKWEEIQLIGNKITVNTFEVKILPDRNFINDMLYDYENHWVKIDAAEYERILESGQR